MGVGIEYMSERRRRAALRRAIWNSMEHLAPPDFDYDAANEIVYQLCGMVNTVVEDFKNVAEFNRIGYRKRHWYAMCIHVSENNMTVQNTLEGADCTPHVPPAHFGFGISYLMFGELSITTQ